MASAELTAATMCASRSSAHFFSDARNGARRQEGECGESHGSETPKHSQSPRARATVVPSKEGGPGLTLLACSVDVVGVDLLIVQLKAAIRRLLDAKGVRARVLDKVNRYGEVVIGVILERPPAASFGSAKALGPGPANGPRRPEDRSPAEGDEDGGDAGATNDDLDRGRSRDR